MRRGHSWLNRSLIALLCVFVLTATAAAQVPDLGGSPFDGIGGFRIGQNAQTSPQENQPKVVASAQITPASDTEPAMLYVTANMAEGWHIYSLTQPSGGPIATKIRINPSSQFRIAGDWQTLPEPKVHHYPEQWKDLPIEEHAGQVTWRAPLELAPGVDAAQLQITGAVYAQPCSHVCEIPSDFAFASTFGEQPPVEFPKISIGDYRADRSHTRIEGQLQRAASGELRLVLSATPDADWYVYAMDVPNAERITRPTLIENIAIEGGTLGPWTADRAPLRKASEVVPGDFDDLYDRTVTWSAPFTLDETSSSAQASEISLSGIIAYQACSGSRCDLLQAAKFNLQTPLSELQPGGSMPLKFTSAYYGEAEKLAKTRIAAGPATTASAGGEGFSVDSFQLANNDSGSILWYIFLGFIGGIILNFMPCVLPVVGLKILAFVEQSGHSRVRGFMLNLAYSLGVIGLFALLSLLPIAWSFFQGEQYIWGEQFGNPWFSIPMTALVFTMAISLLGVWEIPIPGFVGGSTVNKMAAKEGYSGAFVKGGITTILATPCSGPFLGGTLGWTLTQTPLVIFTIFISIGLGMSSPYLLIGIFPRLARFLPKPGAWMETFKHLMGFILLATVVFLFSTIQWTLMLPTLSLLIGLWAACWWIGRTPLTAEFGTKAKAWASAVAFAAAIGWFSFTSLYAYSTKNFEQMVAEKVAASGGLAAEVAETDALEWQPFSNAKLQELVNSNHTVIVDFTAKWCTNCIALKQMILHTPDVKEFVDRHHMVALTADLDLYPDSKPMLLKLDAAAIPTLAIFPAGSPNQPIVFRDGYTKEMLLAALEKASSSQSTTASAAASEERLR